MSLHQRDRDRQRPVARAAPRRQGRPAAGAACRMPGSGDAGLGGVGARGRQEGQPVARALDLGLGRLGRPILIGSAAAARGRGMVCGEPITMGTKLVGAVAAWLAGLWP